MFVHRAHCDGLLPRWRETGLNLEYSTGKWGLLAEEQVGLSGCKIIEGTSGVAGVVVELNQPDGVLC